MSDPRCSLGFPSRNGTASVGPQPYLSENVLFRLLCAVANLGELSFPSAIFTMKCKSCAPSIALHPKSGNRRQISGLTIWAGLLCREPFVTVALPSAGSAGQRRESARHVLANYCS